jgi:hypothetical protein
MRQEMENTRTEIANQKPQNDTETHHLERLLNDKQRLIDQLLDSQAMFHSTINNMRSENPIDHDADFREQNMELQDLILENEQLTDLSNSLAARLRQNTKVLSTSSTQTELGVNNRTGILQSERITASQTKARQKLEKTLVLKPKIRNYNNKSDLI